MSVNARSDAYTGAWLAMKLGVEPRRLDVRRRAGELLGVRAGSDDYLYPTFQFDAGGRTLPGVARVIETARAGGLDDEELYALLLRRDGMTGGTRLSDALRAG